MNILAICGAANKSRNTATMLRNAFEGAMSVPGSKGEIVNLYDLSFKGCRGCHVCKLQKNISLARCVQNDDLSPILSKAKEADVLIIGSPIYYASITGETRSFIERYFFPSMTYNPDKDSVFLYPKRTKVGWVFTLNGANMDVYANYFESLMSTTQRLIGESEYVVANKTKQFDDYSKYAARLFDEEMIEKRHLEQFPKDCEAAFEMGKRLANKL